MRDDLVGRRCAPGGLIFGRVGVAHRGRVIAPDECAVEGRTNTASARTDDAHPDPRDESTLDSRVLVPTIFHAWLPLARGPPNPGSPGPEPRVALPFPRER